MSSYIARIGKNSVAFGMLWTLLPGVNAIGKEIKKLAASHRATEYVTLPIEGAQPLIGLLPMDAYQEKGAARASASSAAALLSIVLRGQIQNAVFGFALSRSKAAFIGFRDGHPLIGFDRVVSIEGLEEVTAEYLTEVEKSSELSSVVFYGTPGLFAGRVVEPAQKEWFGVQPKKPQLAAARMRRAKSRYVLWASLALVLCGAYLGWDQYAAMRQAQDQQEHKVQHVDPNAQYAKAVTSYLEGAGIPANVTAGPLIDAINRLPMFHEGWRLAGASCKPGSCTLAWSNEDGGTYSSFGRAHLPGVQNFKTTYKEGMTALQTTFDYPLNNPGRLKPDYLVQQERFVVDFGSFAQQLKVAGLSIDIGKPAVVALPAGVSEDQLKEKVLEGSWKLSGDWTFYDVLTRLPGNLTIETIDLAVSDGAMSMTISGKYYVKN